MTMAAFGPASPQPISTGSKLQPVPSNDPRCSSESVQTKK
jgi:hypothetical protein